MSREKQRELLADLDAARAKKVPRVDHPLADMVGSIHSEPPMRDWVTLESLSLCPQAVPLARSAERLEAVIYLLLACRAEKDLLHPPWGLLVWHWPSRRLRALLDVRYLLPALPAPLTTAHLATREYLEGVQQAVEHGGPVPVPPEPLPALYARIQEALPLHEPIGDPVKQADTEERSHAPRRGGSGPQMGVTCKPGPAPPPVSDLMTRARGLIEECEQQALLAEWRRLYSRMHRTGFAVAVAGEFNRGKSTLINRLLNEDVLPIGDLPTTAMVARVLYGPTPALWHITPGPHRARMELRPESWTGLTAQDSGIDPEGVMEVQLTHDWLQKTGIQFVDTPGAGDLTGNRVALATDAIAHCDATLVAVSATMPLSLTERAFVDEHVLSREMPRVAVVLTRLDQVPQSDRLDLLRFVADKLRGWAPRVELWCVHGHDMLPKEAPVTVSGPEEIRDRLASWASAPDHVRLRSFQVVAQLQELVQALRGVLAAGLAAASASEEERKRALQQESEALARRKLDWEDLRLEMEARCRSLGQWLEEATREAKPRVTESLVYEMQHASNPKEWWEKDLPYRLRRELLLMSRPLNQSVLQRVSGDAEWLHSQVKQRFSWTLTLPDAAELVGGQEAATGQDEAELRGVSDLSQIRLWTRLGLGALTVTGIVFPVIRLVALGGALAGGAITERLFKGKIEEQKGKLEPALASAVDDAVDKGAACVFSRLEKYYRTITREAMRQETLWFQARKEALLQSEDGTRLEESAHSTEELRRCFERAEGLVGELSEWLGRGGQ